MPAELDLELIRERHFASLRASGCNAVGVCNQESLKGGPPSTDLTRELPSARSAIVFSMPLDQEKIEKYMAKIDHSSHQQDYIRTNNVVQGLASEQAHQLRGQGFDAVQVYAGNTKSGGDHRDVTPQTDAQREAAERYPAKESDYMIGAIPLLSQRLLAAAAGVGFFGMSGNILTESHGATVVLGAVVTSADLPPTPVLPPEVNYCDECNWCGNVCPTDYMSRTDFTRVEMGGHDHHKYSTRLHPARCGMHMTGAVSQAPNGRWGSWGPSQKRLPDDDDKLLPIVMEVSADIAKRPEIPGGFISAQAGTKTNIMCSACNLVCHPDRKVRARRVKLWRQGGVVVQHEDGHLESMPADDARAFLDAMPPERRALYEVVES